MKQKLSLIILIILLIAQTGAGYAQGNTAKTEKLKIILIRHGEKPKSGDNLSCQGLNRAMQLPRVLHSKFGIPDFTYVPGIKNGKSTSHARMFQTITPFATQYNLEVNTKFDVENFKEIADHLLSKTGTLLLVWEHAGIKGIATALGVKKTEKGELKWPDEDFDSIWIITFPKGVATLTKDKEGLHPSAECKN